MCLMLTIFFICVIMGDKDGRHERVPENGAKTEPRGKVQTSRPRVHLEQIGRLLIFLGCSRHANFSQFG